MKSTLNVVLAIAGMLALTIAGLWFCDQIVAHVERQEARRFAARHDSEIDAAVALYLQQQNEQPGNPGATPMP